MNERVYMYEWKTRAAGNRAWQRGHGAWAWEIFRDMERRKIPLDGWRIFEGD